MKDKLAKCFADVLGPWPEPVDARYGDGKWDSVSHMMLVADIEEAFGIMLTTDEVVGMSTFGEALTIVERHAG